MEDCTFKVSFKEAPVIGLEVNLKGVKIVEFVFKNTVSIEKWEEFVENLKKTDIEKDYHLNFNNDSISMMSWKDEFEINVGEFEDGFADLKICLKKNESLYDAFNKMLSFVKENNK